MEEKKIVRIRADSKTYDKVKMKMEHAGIGKVTYQNMWDFLAKQYIETDELETAMNSKMLKMFSSIVEGVMIDFENRLNKSVTHILSELSINVGILNQYMINDVCIGIREEEKKEKDYAYRVLALEKVKEGRHLRMEDVNPTD